MSTSAEILQDWDWQGIQIDGHVTPDMLIPAIEEQNQSQFKLPIRIEKDQIESKAGLFKKRYDDCIKIYNTDTNRGPKESYFVTVLKFGYLGNVTVIDFKYCGMSYNTMQYNKDKDRIFKKCDQHAFDTEYMYYDLLHQTLMTLFSK